MQRVLKFIFELFFVILLIGGAASLFPVMGEFFERLPYWALCPMRICAGVFLAFMFFGYLVNCGIFQRLFGQK